MVSMFVWEISQELSEPYQSAVTKVITCKDAVGAFFIHPPAFEWNHRHLFDHISLKFVVCWIFLFYCYWKAQAKTKGWERKVPVILCCEILYQFLTDCDRPKRAQSKAAWFLVSIDLWTVLNVAASKSQSWTKETLSLYFKPADWFFSQS